MNPLNEQGEPILKSYNSDPNNFQMNMILGRVQTSVSIAEISTAFYMQYARETIFLWPLKRAQSADESCDEFGIVKRLEFTTS